MGIKGLLDSSKAVRQQGWLSLDEARSLALYVDLLGAFYPPTWLSADLKARTLLASIVSVADGVSRVVVCGEGGAVDEQGRGAGFKAVKVVRHSDQRNTPQGGLDGVVGVQHDGSAAARATGAVAELIARQAPLLAKKTGAEVVVRYAIAEGEDCAAAALADDLNEGRVVLAEFDFASRRSSSRPLDPSSLPQPQQPLYDVADPTDRRLYASTSASPVPFLLPRPTQIHTVPVRSSRQRQSLTKTPSIHTTLLTEHAWHDICQRPALTPSERRSRARRLDTLVTKSTAADAAERIRRGSSDLNSRGTPVETDRRLTDDIGQQSATASPTRKLAAAFLSRDSDSYVRLHPATTVIFSWERIGDGFLIDFAVVGSVLAHFASNFIPKLLSTYESVVSKKPVLPTDADAAAASDLSSLPDATLRLVAFQLAAEPHKDQSALQSLIQAAGPVNFATGSLLIASGGLDDYSSCLHLDAPTKGHLGSGRLALLAGMCNSRVDEVYRILARIGWEFVDAESSWLRGQLRRLGAPGVPSSFTSMPSHFTVLPTPLPISRSLLSSCITTALRSRSSSSPTVSTSTFFAALQVTRALPDVGTSSSLTDFSVGSSKPGDPIILPGDPAAWAEEVWSARGTSRLAAELGQWLESVDGSGVYRYWVMFWEQTGWGSEQAEEGLEVEDGQEDGGEYEEVLQDHEFRALGLTKHGLIPLVVDLNHARKAESEAKWIALGQFAARLPETPAYRAIGVQSVNLKVGDVPAGSSKRAILLSIDGHETRFYAPSGNYRQLLQSLVAGFDASFLSDDTFSAFGSGGFAKDAFRNICFSFVDEATSLRNVYEPFLYTVCKINAAANVPLLGPAASVLVWLEQAGLADTVFAHSPDALDVLLLEGVARQTYNPQAFSYRGAPELLSITQSSRPSPPISRDLTSLNLSYTLRHSTTDLAALFGISLKYHRSSQRFVPTNEAPFASPAEAEEQVHELLADFETSEVSLITLRSVCIWASKLGISQGEYSQRKWNNLKLMWERVRDDLLGYLGWEHDALKEVMGGELVWRPRDELAGIFKACWVWHGEQPKRSLEGDE
ncbi:hypothetical protein JCM11641_001055 [Rhodosporidiobolus odoratus]